MGHEPVSASSALSDVPTELREETALKGWKEEGGEGGGKGRVEVTRRAGRRGGKWEGSHGQLRGGGGSGGAGSARRDRFSQALSSRSFKTHQPRLPGGARTRLSVPLDAKVALMWGPRDPGGPGALWVPEF